MYWMANLRSSFGHYLMFEVFVLLLALCAEGIGLAVTIGVPKVFPIIYCSLGCSLSSFGKQLAMRNVVSMIIMLLFILFGGFYLNSENTPVYFTWVPYISFVKYGMSADDAHSFRSLIDDSLAFEGVFENEFSGRTFDCDPDELCLYRTCVFFATLACRSSEMTGGTAETN